MAKKIKLVPKTIPSPFSEEDAMAILESLQEEFGDKIVEKIIGANQPGKKTKVGKKDLKLTYQLKIQLRGVKKPPVWRRVLVPAQFTFSGLHAVIQDSFGWCNAHLYMFNETPYSKNLTITEPDEDDWDKPDYNALEFTLGEFFGKGEEIKRLCYVYDFGDDWIHDITLEKVISEYSECPSCVAGKGACPDEDCGGLWGYAAMKEAGDVNDATYFDVEEVNDLLSDMPYDGYGKIFN